MANECGTDTEVGIAAMRRLMRRARALDATRPVTFCAAGGAQDHLAFDEADMVCVNLYPGTFADLDPASGAFHIADMESRVAGPMAQQLREVCSLYPSKPVLVTEYGARSITGMHGDAPCTEEHHSAYIEAVWRGIRASPGVAGGVLWSWADYYHQRDFVGLTSPMPFGPFGVVTGNRKPKLPLQALARIYAGSA
jgi:hypothetical protein